jgi:hypothetical protein
MGIATWLQHTAVSTTPARLYTHMVQPASVWLHLLCISLAWTAARPATALQHAEAWLVIPSWLLACFWEVCKYAQHQPHMSLCCCNCRATATPPNPCEWFWCRLHSFRSCVGEHRLQSGHGNQVDRWGRSGCPAGPAMQPCH